MRIHGGRLRRLVLVLSLGVVGSLVVASATSAQGGPNGEGHTPVTICHKPGTPAEQTEVVDDDAVPAHLAHGDYLGECQSTPPPVDVCPNIEGDQQVIPDGYQLVDGQCMPIPPPPRDVCTNLEGIQESVPAGYHAGEDENGRPTCIEDAPPPKDVCKNIDGIQETVPAGYFALFGKCFPIPPPPTFTYCLGGETHTTHSLIEYLFKLAHGAKKGECPPPPPNDVCPNIEGVQEQIPAGMVKNEQGNCVEVKHDDPPPPPPPPSVASDEFMDVQVSKDATAQVQLVNGQAEIAYTVRVRNNGPNQAHNVKLVDAAPSGVTFVSVTTQPVGGSCTVSSALLDCSLGTLGPGVERTIGLSARVTQTGTYVNSASAVGDGKDTNGANNTDDASTLVTAPATPPVTPKPQPRQQPKPKPTLDICRILKVTPGMVKVDGKRQLVLAKVTQARHPVAGVAVRFAGTGFTAVVKTNKQGVARFSIKPSKAGIMLVRITSAKACNSARIGVIGAFEPPVTG